MTTYLVTWELELDADSVEDAAKKALEIQRDRNSIATVFYVVPKCSGCGAFHEGDEHEVDLLQETHRVH